MINTGRLIRLPSGSEGGSKAKESGSSPSEKNEMKLISPDFIGFFYISDGTRAAIGQFYGPYFLQYGPLAARFNSNVFIFPEREIW